MRRAALLLLTLLAVPAQAWEADVHYGLSYWLALQAGYSESEADILARAADYADVKCSAISLMVWRVCLQRDEEASLQIRKHHFPSAGPVPAAPDKRPVEKDKNTGFDDGDPGYADYCPCMRDIPGHLEYGPTLHALQDSWSHRGKPDVPHAWSIKLCWPTLSWSHPRKRGGWLSHDADLTPKHVADTLEMAQRTFETLYEARHGKAPDAAQWDELQPAVEAFAASRTKRMKRDWFRQAPKWPQSNSLSFLDHISLPEDDAAPELVAASNAPWRFVPARFDNSVVETRRIDDFLTTWIIQRRLDALLERVNPAPLLESYGQEVRAFEAATVLRTLLGMWLVKDHGWVNSLGHGAPASLSESADPAFAAFGNLVAQVSRLDFSTKAEGELGDYIEAPLEDPEFQPEGRPYLAAQDPERGQVAVVFRFKHTPNDVLLLVFDPRDNRLDGFTWLAR